MGNRAAIAIRKTKGSPAIYLHWNGGPESVLAFLHAAKELEVRSPANDEDYCLGRLGQIIGNFFGGTTSLGFGRVGYVDDSDNGTTSSEATSRLSTAPGVAPRPWKNWTRATAKSTKASRPASFATRQPPSTIPSTGRRSSSPVRKGNNHVICT